MCDGDPPVREERGLSPSHSSASLPNRQSSDIAVGCSCVDHDEVVAAFFHPSPEGIVPAMVAGASPARRLRDAIEPIAMHAVWSRRTNERLAGLGLDFLAGYVWGRAAALGEAAPGVVVSSFAVFEPGMLAATYEQGRTTCSRDDLVAARTESTIESLHDVLGDADVAPIAERLTGAVRSVATANVAGRPLFAGLAGQPWPEDPFGRLWRACELLREHRGDGHIAACTAAGLGPVTMNVITELWIGMPLAPTARHAAGTPSRSRRGRGSACRGCARGR